MFKRVFLASALALSFAPVLSAVAVAADSYKVDASHSSINFRILHFGAGYTYGRFNDFAGTVSFDDANPGASKVEVTVQATSVDTGVVKRDDHLRSPDFFSVKEFPTISFVGKSYTKKADGSWDVTGELTLHGVKKTVTVNVVKVGQGKGMMGEARAGYLATLNVKRSEYGMTQMLEGIGDDVRMEIALEGVKQ